MDAFRIIGEQPLSGTIKPQGAKNEALQIISACLLTKEKILLENVPDIHDVNRLLELLSEMGVSVEKTQPNTFTVQAKEVNTEYLISDEFKKMSGKLRGSVMLAGPLLARYHKAYIPQPGGDKIGRRRLDTHILGFESLGVKADFDEEEHLFILDAGEGINYSGTVFLEEPSVTGTANIIMASVLNQGVVELYNAACEPYIQQLCKMLVNMGAKIDGIGSNLLKIQGVEQLGSTTHRMLADMIEVGSFIGMAAATQSEIRIQDADVNHLGIIPEVFTKLGIDLDIQGNDILVPRKEVYQIQKYIDGSMLTVSDHPWPGFTPDLLSIVLIAAAQAKGNVLVHQKMFESRLFFVDKLIEMGAQIVLCDPHRAVVMGLNRSYKLKGIKMVSPDIRAGVTLLIAALSARGQSIIQNINQIDRGYEDIDGRLRALGADIERINY